MCVGRSWRQLIAPRGDADGSGLRRSLRDARLKPGEQPVPEVEEKDGVVRALGVEASQIERAGVVIGGAAVTALDDGWRSLELLARG